MPGPRPRQAVITITRTGNLAERLLERWGSFPALPDGETSSGRQKFRIVTAEELAERAIDVAEAIELKLIARGHMYEEE